MRVKLITAVLALVAIALVVISVAGLGFLKSYLLNQADDQLTGSGGVAQVSQGYVDRYLSRNQTYAYSEPFVIAWLPHGGRVHPVVQEISGLNSPGSSSSSPPSTGQLKPGPKIRMGAGWLSGGEIVTVGATSGDGRYRVLALPNQTFLGPSGSVTGTVIVAWDVSSVYQTLGKLTGIDIIVSGILLLGLAVIGVTVIRVSLRPLTDIEKTAEAIAAGDLSRRVPDRDPRTEIGRLGRSLNTMLAQIETAFHARTDSEVAARRSEDRMRQFVADASHELRTPLTAIRGFAEYYRQRGGVSAGGGGSGELAPADLDRIMRRVEQEASRMGVLVEDMLLLARLDQQRPLECRTVDLLTLAADAVHDARVVAPERAINLTVGSGAALLVLGDEVRLRQVIGNLMSNALSHTPDGTPIDVRLRSGSLDEARAPGTAQPGPMPAPLPAPPAASAPPAPPAPPAPSAPPVPSAPPAPTAPAPAPVMPAPVDPGAAAGPKSAAVLEVTDHGPGLTREQAEHAFERFYRADRSRTSSGTGLGLAIVAALVAAHGGTVWVESVPGAGATFRIALPLAPEALHDDDQDDSVEDGATPGDDDTDGLPPGPQRNDGQAGRPHVNGSRAGQEAPGTDAQEHDPLLA
jgi:two-component system OmpR family sensor kinase